MPTFVTPKPWAGGLQHDAYGTAETYRLAAEWLKDCPDVADWGASRGAFQAYLPPTVRYTPVDGTMQCAVNDWQVLADLSRYDAPASGILLRHVLDQTEDWRAVLENALAAFRQRMVVVTFTPDAPVTQVAKIKSGWPILHFNPNDLRALMGDLLVTDRAVLTTHPERIYYLERRA